jgi:hypothetical protein
MDTKFLLENLKESKHLGYLDVVDEDGGGDDIGDNIF